MSKLSPNQQRLLEALQPEGIFIEEEIYPWGGRSFWLVRLYEDSASTQDSVHKGTFKALEKTGLLYRNLERKPEEGLPIDRVYYSLDPAKQPLKRKVFQ